MQPLAGLHIGSLIDSTQFDVDLHHEDWHGPYATSRAARYDIVFLTGLQPDFDRMRQLSWFFRREGAVVVAGGSICTQFPDFAAEFFDAVCAGGVEIVPEVIADFVRGELKRIYRAPPGASPAYRVDYSLFARSGVRPSAHFVEASRGCSFRCSFCVIPAEFGGHARHDRSALAASIESALANSPLLSLRRWYPTVVFLDNNFSDDRAHMLAVSEMMRVHPRIRAWTALVTQNVLHDRELIRHLARAKCISLFVGLESFDHEFLRRYNKKQNLGRTDKLLDDIAFAEAQGIVIGYGYLFDPRFQSVAAMEAQVRLIAETDTLPMPIYMSLVAPLLGTAAFWEELRAGTLAANLRLRDLDGETIGYAHLADPQERVAEFVDRMFRRPWSVVSRATVLCKLVRRLILFRSANPVLWWVVASAMLHCFIWARAYPSQRRTYGAGEDVLDPQYFEHPPDLSEEERVRYFEPIAVTDARGRASDWLRPYTPLTHGAPGGGVVSPAAEEPP